MTTSTSVATVPTLPQTKENLTKLKKLLTEAEDSQRLVSLGAASASRGAMGDHYKTIYIAKKNIATYFHHEIGNLDVAIGYYKEALEASKMIHSSNSDGAHASTGAGSSDVECEVEGNLNLGRALEKQGKNFEALNYYEQSRKLANFKGDTNAETLASRCIVLVRTKIAEQVFPEITFI